MTAWDRVAFWNVNVISSAYGPWKEMTDRLWWVLNMSTLDLTSENLLLPSAAQGQEKRKIKGSDGVSLT